MEGVFWDFQGLGEGSLKKPRASAQEADCSQTSFGPVLPPPTPPVRAGSSLSLVQMEMKNPSTEVHLLPHEVGPAHGKEAEEWGRGLGRGAPGISLGTGPSPIG